MTATKIPPKPGKDTIYVDVDDEITSIIDKVEGAKEKVVALVLPKRATVLQSVVNMRLLKRNAEKAGKNVVLITAEEALLPLAGMAGLHVAKNLQSKPEVPTAPVAGAAKAAPELPEDIDTADEEPTGKLDYHRTVGELAAVKAEDEGDAIDLDGDDEDDAEEDSPKEAKVKTPKDKKLKVPNFDRFRLLVLGGGALFILLIVFIVLAIFVLPKATITITTGSTPVSANITLNAADSVKTLDEKGDNIPAVVKNTNQVQTQSVPATGQQNNGTKATGTVSMTAEKCSGNPFTPPSDVPAGTGISTGGSTYITQANTSFTGSGTSGGCYTYSANSSTAITAQTGGTKFNVTGANFTVAGRSDVTASGSASGGTDSVVTVVSQTDLNNAAAKLSSSTTSAFTKKFEDTLASQGLYVLTSTLKPGTPATTASPALGQPASTTTVTTTITYTVLAVQKSDLSKILSDSLESQIDKSKQKLSAGNVLSAAKVSVADQSAPNVATLSVSEDTTAIPIINEANIKKQATGQKTGDIRSAVGGLPGVKSVDVKLSPFWVSKAPKISKITVVQKQVTGDDK